MANLEDAGRRSPKRAKNIRLNKLDERFWMRVDPWLPAIFVGAVLFLWEWLSRAGHLSTLFFPAPSTILITLYQMVSSGKLLPHLVATVLRLSAGFLIGAVAGLILGLGMGWSPRLRVIVDPMIAATHPIPKIAIFPLIMIIFGIGEASKIVAIAIAATRDLSFMSASSLGNCTRRCGVLRWLPRCDSVREGP